MQSQSRLLNGILILGHVYLLPFPAFNARADLRRALALVRLLIRVDRFSHAYTATGTVLAGEAIEQARVALAAVAVAITGLLVEYFLHSRRENISGLYGDVCELRRAERLRKLALRRFVVKRWHGFLNGLGQVGSHTRFGNRHTQRRSAQNRAAHDSAFRSHATPLKTRRSRLRSLSRFPLYLCEREISTTRFNSDSDPAQGTTTPQSLLLSSASRHASRASCAAPAVPTCAQMKNSGF